VTLEVIARSRGEGVLQSELPKQFGKQPTNFSYTLRRLLTAGLITKAPIKLRGGTANSTTLSTSLLRHVAFAPAQSGAMQAAADDAARSGLLQDDSAALTQITDQLAALPGQMVAEVELKTFLGYSGVRGHRTWRKLREKLRGGGFIADVTTSLEVRCVSHMAGAPAQLAAAVRITAPN
jgi:B-block binding subunit of TFIIIC